MCFNCGKDGHMARFCRKFRGNYQRRHWIPVQNPEVATQGAVQVNPPAGNLVATTQGLRITEAPDVAAIKVLSAVSGGVKVVQELVKYVDPAEIFEGERWKRGEVKRPVDSDTIRFRKRVTMVPM